jgi:hypothetical protein
MIPSRVNEPSDAAGVQQHPSRFQRAGPYFATIAIAVLAVLVLQLQGRRWWCACGQPYPWVSEVRGPHNSQHLFDPYSFTHVLHGLIYYWLFVWLLPRWPMLWRCVLAIALAAAWELIENSDMVIDRYRTATMSVGYQGDSIANSLGDIVSCAVGFWLARWLGWRWSIVYMVASELVLLVWIRDNLLLTMLMPLWPIEAIKQWQLGG